VAGLKEAEPRRRYYVFWTCSVVVETVELVTLPQFAASIKL
jgi:hypothetical protein